MKPGDTVQTLHPVNFLMDAGEQHPQYLIGELVEIWNDLATIKATLVLKPKRGITRRFCFEDITAIWVEVPLVEIAPYPKPIENDPTRYQRPLL